MSDSGWDSREYDRHFSFVSRYGEGLFGLLDTHGGMSCLDLGCGTGTLTAELQARGLDVVGMDSSREQLAQARASHPGVRFFRGDAVDFSLERPVDVVFSNAVLHWIPAEDHPSLLSSVFRALKPGGQFVFEMGGVGNNALIHAALGRAFASRGLTYRMPFYFPTIGDEAALLERAGFLVRDAMLFDRPTVLDGPDGLAGWVRMFVRGPFEGLDGAVRDEIVDDAVGELEPALFRDGVWHADYVRLRMKAVRPEAGQRAPGVPQP